MTAVWVVALVLATFTGAAIGFTAATLMAASRHADESTEEVWRDGTD